MHDRRRFLRTGLAGAGLVVASPRLALSREAARPVVKAGSDAVTLGRSGVTTSFLAFGTGMNGGRRSSDMTRLGQAEFTRILRRGLDQGVRFLDMADLYGTHPFVREAVKGVPRDRYTILTKIWPYMEDWIYGAGKLTRPEDKEASLRYVLGRGVVDAITIGTTAPPHVDDNLKGIAAAARALAG